MSTFPANAHSTELRPDRFADGAGGDAMRPLILITGFGPFRGAPVNPTADLVRALCRIRRPAFADIRRAAHIFETSYAAVDADLPDLIARHRPRVLLMFGLAARTKSVRIEMKARNVRSQIVADVAGARPLVNAITLHAASPRHGRAPFIQMVTASCAVRVPARLSHSAGNFLCNHLYWRALDLRTADRPTIVVFVHVPAVRRPRHRRPFEGRSITSADLARMGEAVLRVTVAAMQRPPLHPLS
jgi:pyroglutamyl-peptidase